MPEIRPAVEAQDRFRLGDRPVTGASEAEKYVLKALGVTRLTDTR